MTPQEKAEELVEKCKIVIYNEVPTLQSDMFHLCILKSAKQCALIAVDEILQLLPEIAFGNRVIKFYEEVKQEILTYGGNK